MTKVLNKTPFTEELRSRILLILVEEVNNGKTGIPTFIENTTDRLLELVMDEIKYGKR